MYQSIAVAPTVDVNISVHEKRVVAIAKLRQLFSNICVHHNRNQEAIRNVFLAHAYNPPLPRRLLMCLVGPG
jgi:uncharacterized DUF497 family protein